jgi:hypothetical protein
MPTHKRWDVDIEPVLTVRPGDTIAVETDDFAGGQVSRDSTHDDLLALDFNEIYPLRGRSSSRAPSRATRWRSSSSSSTCPSGAGR